MNDPLAYEFEQWLKKTTQGLSNEVNAVAVEELRAHYEDSVAAFVEKGETAVSAHQLALKALGSSRETRQGLRETHLAGRRYQTAVVLGLGLLILMPVGLFTIATEWVLGLTVFMPLFFALYTLDFYLRQTYFFDGARRPVQLLLLGGGVSTVISSLLPVLLGCSIFQSGGCSGGKTMSLTVFTLLYVGIVLVGIGFLNLSCILKTLKDVNSVMLTTLRYLFFINGITLLIGATAVILQAYGMAALMTFILVFTLMITLGGLILLFFRVAAQERRFEFTI